MPQRQIVSVSFIAIDDDVAFSGVGIGKHQAHTVDVGYSTCQRCDLRIRKVINDRFDRLAIASDFSFDCLEGRDEIREVSSAYAKSADIFAPS